MASHSRHLFFSTRRHRRVLRGIYGSGGSTLDETPVITSPSCLDYHHLHRLSLIFHRLKDDIFYPFDLAFGTLDAERNRVVSLALVPFTGVSKPPAPLSHLRPFLRWSNFICL